jgi:LPXTG-motif cell wall-anchored protein
MYRRELTRLASAVGVALIICLGVFTIRVLAAHSYQTVPTLPPPTLTPSQTPNYTPTGVSLPTATLPQSATAYPIEASQPPASSTMMTPGYPGTQTAQAAASETILATGSSTEVPAQITSTSIPAAGITSTQVEMVQTKNPIISTQALSKTGGNNTNLYGLIGGGIVLVAILFLLIWLRQPHRHGKA